MPSASLLRAVAATLVLALSASAETLRVPQDFATIQAAVDAAEPGDTVLVAGGSYTETLTLDGHDELTLRGKGKVTLTPLDPDDDAVTVSDCDGLRLEKLTIRDARVGVVVGASRDVALVDLRLDTHQLLGLDVATSTDVFVRDVRVDGTPGGVRLTQVARGVVSGARISDVSGVGVEAIETNGLVVQGCRVSGDGSGLGVAVQANSRESLIEGNRLQDLALGVLVDAGGTRLVGNRLGDVIDGISIAPDSGFLQRPTVAVDNRLSKVAQTAIYVESNFVLLGENRIAGAETGIELDAFASTSLVHGNRVKADPGRGILIDCGSVTLAQNKLKPDDVVDNVGEAVFLGDGPLSDGDTLRVPQDFAELQDALDAAMPGDTVLIGAGTYVGAFTLTGAVDVTLRGKGKAVLSQPGGTALTLDGCERVRVEKLRFEDADRGLLSSGSSAVEVVTCRFSGIATLGAEVVGGDSALVERCRFDVEGSGLRLVSPRSVSRNNRSRGSGALDGTGLQTDGMLMVVSGERVRDFATGLDVGAGDADTVGNRVRDCDVGVSVRAFRGLARGNRVVGGGVGISAPSSEAFDEVHLLDNRVSKPAMQGLLLGVNSLVLVGNRIAAAGEEGVLFGEFATEVLLVGNVVKGSGLDGVLADDSEDCAFFDNRFVGNGGLDLRAEQGDGHVLIDNKLGQTNLDDV